MSQPSVAVTHCHLLTVTSSAICGPLIVNSFLTFCNPPITASLETVGDKSNLIPSHVCVCVSVNNAGVGLLGPVESISIDEMKRVFETNFFGVVRMIKEVMPDMKKRRSGHIVVMSSVMGLQGTTRLVCFKWCRE